MTASVDLVYGDSWTTHILQTGSIVVPLLAWIGSLVILTTEIVRPLNVVLRSVSGSMDVSYRVTSST